MFKTGDQCRRATGGLKTHGVQWVPRVQPSGDPFPGGIDGVPSMYHHFLGFKLPGVNISPKKSRPTNSLRIQFGSFPFLLAAYVYISMLQHPSRILLQVCRGYLAKASTESWMALGDGLVTQCSVSLQNSFGGLEEPAKYVISKLRFGRW